jgi:hypothetical protein
MMRKLRGESSRKGADLLDKEYYDKLKAIHDLVKDTKKVRDAILLVGEIGDIYVNSYQKMLADPHFRYEEPVPISNGYTILLQQSADMLMEVEDVVNGTVLFFYGLMAILITTLIKTAHNISL